MQLLTIIELFHFSLLKMKTLRKRHFKIKIGRNHVTKSMKKVPKQLGN